MIFCFGSKWSFNWKSSGPGLQDNLRLGDNILEQQLNIPISLATVQNVNIEVINTM